MPIPPGVLPEAQRRTGVARWGRWPGHRLIRGREGALGWVPPENWKTGKLAIWSASQFPRTPDPQFPVGWISPTATPKSAGHIPRIYKISMKNWWAHQDLNLGPADYESDALTN